MTIKSCISIISATLLGILLLWITAIVIIPRLLDLDKYKPKILSSLEKSLNRQVSYESASFSRQLIPTFVLKGLVIKEKQGDTNLLTVDQLSFRLALLPLLHKEVHLKGIVLERPVFSFARDQAGVFSFSDLLSGKPSAYELQISDIQVRNGQIRFSDQLNNDELLMTSLEKLDLQLNGLTRGGTTEFKLNTVLQGQGEGAPLTLAGKVVIPAPNRPLTETMLDLALSVKNLDAGRYWPYYGRFLPFERIQGRLDVEGGTFTGKLKEFATKGRLSLRDLRCNYPGVFRAPLAPKRIDLRYDLELTSRRLAAKTIDLTVDGLQVKGSGNLDDIHGNDPHLTVRVGSSLFRFEDVQSYIPYGVIPAATADFIEQHIKGGTFRVDEVRLDGRISQFAHMEQGTNYNALFIRASVDNGVMTFGPQVPPISGIKGGLEFRGKDFILNGLTGRFGGSPFSLDGKIADYPLATPASYPFTLTMTPGQAEVAWLLRQEKPGQIAFSGPSQLRLAGSGIAADYRLSGTWDLSRADYRFPQLLHKPVGLTNRLSFNAILGPVEARLTELHYLLPSLDVTANAVYRYDDQRPLSIAVATDRFEVSDVLSLFPLLVSYHPSGRLQAVVSADGDPAAPDSFKWHGAVTLAELSLRPLEQIPPVEHLNGTINVTGTGLETQQLTGRLGSSDFSATGSLRGFDNPAIEAAFASPGLHLSDLGLRASGQDPVLKNLAARITLQDRNLTIASLTGEFNRTVFALQGNLPDLGNQEINLRVRFPYLHVEDLQLLAGLKPVDAGVGKPARSALKIKVEADAGTVREIPFTGLVAQISLLNSHLDLHTVRLGIFGGTAAGSGTAELASAGGPAYQGKYQLEHVDAVQFLKAAGSASSVSGKLTAAGEVTLQGNSPAELRKSAAVTARLHLQDGVIQSPLGQGEKFPYSIFDADLAYNKGTLTVQGLHAGIFGGTVSGSGSAGLDSASGSGYQGKYRLESVDAAQLLKAAGSKSSVSGKLTAAGEVTLQGNSPAELKKSAAVTARLHLQDGVIQSPLGQGETFPYSVFDADLVYNKGTLTVQGLRAGIFGGTVSGSGTAELDSAEGPGYQAQYRLEGIDAAQFLKAAGAAPALSGQLTAAGSLTARGSSTEELQKSARMTADVELNSGRLVIAPAGGVKSRHEIPFKAFQSRLSFENRRLSARSVRIDIFDGTVFADGVADFTAPHDPGYQVTLHVKSIEAAGVDEAFGFTSDISGRLNFEGELAARGDSPASLKKSLQGAFEIHFEKGVINKFGFVSKVFSILNVSQLFSLRLPDMVSTGMPYDSINGSFSVKYGIFSSSDLDLDSPSINMTVVGKTDIVKQELDLLCAVQPLQTLSMIVSRIPVIGWLLTGGDKKFLVSYYEAKGNWNDPTVTGRNISQLPGGVYNVFKRFYNLPENMFTNTGQVFMGN